MLQVASNLCIIYAGFNKGKKAITLSSSQAAHLERFLLDPGWNTKVTELENLLKREAGVTAAEIAEFKGYFGNANERRRKFEVLAGRSQGQSALEKAITGWMSRSNDSLWLSVQTDVKPYIYDPTLPVIRIPWEPGRIFGSIAADLARALP